jgi:hypothetical protein
METLHFITSLATAVALCIIVPAYARLLKISKAYTEIFDLSKLQAYAKLLEEKHITEQQLQKYKMGQQSLANLVKMQNIKKELQNHYTQLLVETTAYLRSLDIQNKDAFIKSNFPSHYNFFKITVIDI